MPRTAAPLAPVPAQAVDTLRVDGPAGTHWYFELFVADCASAATEGCPIAVTFVDGAGTRTAPFELTWARALSPVTIGSAELGPDPGELYAPAPARALKSGTEASELTTTGRSLLLAPDRPALLVDQWGGFEHVKAAHTLVGMKARQLSELWRTEDPQGPAWSSTAVLPLEEGRQRILLVTQLDLNEAMEDQPDQLSAQLVSMDPASGEIADAAAGRRAHAVVLGPFRTLEQASAARAASGACLRGYALLLGDAFEAGGAGETFVLATLATSRAAAERLEAQARACAKGVRTHLTTLRSQD